MADVGSAAPAEPGCVYTKNLVNKAEYADGLGNPVTRTRWWGTYVVKVSIPRCEACQLRNWGYSDYGVGLGSDLTYLRN